MNKQPSVPDAEAVLSDTEAVLAKNRRRKKRTFRAALYIIIFLVLAAVMYVCDLAIYRPTEFNPAGEAGVYSEITVECIQPITEANGWYYLFYVNQTDKKLGILKASPTDFEMLSAAVDTYAGASASYTSSVKVRGLSAPLDSDFMDACISSGFADSETDTQFTSVYGLVCLCMNTRNVTLFYFIYKITLYVLFPLSVLWLLLCILLHGMKKRRSARTKNVSAPLHETGDELNDDF